MSVVLDFPSYYKPFDSIFYLQDKEDAWDREYYYLDAWDDENYLNFHSYYLVVNFFEEALVASDDYDDYDELLKSEVVDMLFQAMFDALHDFPVYHKPDFAKKAAAHILDWINESY